MARSKVGGVVRAEVVESTRRDVAAVETTAKGDLAIQLASEAIRIQGGKRADQDTIDLLEKGAVELCKGQWDGDDVG